MITHKDPEIQFLINQIEQQRDLALSQSSALYKKVVDLSKKIEDLENEKKNKKNTVISINKVKKIFKELERAP
jgi:replication-associated recombination protein RarA